MQHDAKVAGRASWFDALDHSSVIIVALVTALKAITTDLTYLNHLYLIRPKCLSCWFYDCFAANRLIYTAEKYGKS